MYRCSSLFLINVIGFPLRKYWRMMYWMPKFKNLSPWPVPDPLPEDTFELAKIAIERITSVEPNMNVSILEDKVGFIQLVFVIECAF